MLGDARALKELRRVLFDESVELQKAVEAPHAAQHARYGAGRSAEVEEGAGVVMEGLESHEERIEALVDCPRQEALHIALVCQAGVLAKALFQQNVAFISLQILHVIKKLFSSAKLQQNIEIFKFRSKSFGRIAFSSYFCIGIAKLYISLYATQMNACNASHQSHQKLFPSRNRHTDLFL